MLVAALVTSAAVDDGVAAKELLVLVPSESVNRQQIAAGSMGTRRCIL
jgi:hypothetical protein